MGTSSKRFIIMTLMIDIILAMAFAFGTGTDNPSNQITSFGNGLEGVTNNGTTQFVNPTVDTGQQYLEKTFGDTWSAGRLISGILSTRTKIPDNMQCSDCPDTTSYNTLTKLFTLFLAIMHLLAIFEVIQLIVNRKQD